MRMLDLGPDTGLEFFGCIQQHISRLCFVQGLALAQAHGHMPAHLRRDTRAFFNALVARIGKHHALLPMQQSIPLVDVVHMRGCAFDGMHQARVGIHANVRFPIKLASTAVPTLSSNPLPISRSQAVRQNPFGQLVLLQPVAKAQDGAFVGHPAVRIELGKLVVQRNIEISLFHGRV